MRDEAVGFVKPCLAKDYWLAFTTFVLTFFGPSVLSLLQNISKYWNRCNNDGTQFNESQI